MSNKTMLAARPRDIVRWRTWSMPEALENEVYEADYGLQVAGHYITRTDYNDSPQACSGFSEFEIIYSPIPDKYGTVVVGDNTVWGNTQYFTATCTYDGWMVVWSDGSYGFRDKSWFDEPDNTCYELEIQE